MRNDKLFKLIGFAQKAGRLALGYDAVCSAVDKRKARLIFFALDTSDRTKAVIMNIALKKGVKYIELGFDMEELSILFGKNVGVFAVTDKNFAESMISQADENDMQGGIHI